MGERARGREGARKSALKEKLHSTCVVRVLSRRQKSWKKLSLLKIYIYVCIYLVYICMRVCVCVLVFMRYLYKLSADALFFPLIRISFAICQPAGSPPLLLLLLLLLSLPPHNSLQFNFYDFILAKSLLAKRLLATWPLGELQPFGLGLRRRKKKRKKEGNEKQKQRQRQRVDLHL